MDAICAIAHRHSLHLIEDCAHAIETQYHGRHAGTLGDFGAFSFYVTKSVTTGEGGMITTGNAVWADRIRMLSLHGLTAGAWKRFSDECLEPYEVVEAGFKYNMTDLQAALGLHQLARVEAGLEHRREIWARYDGAFQDLPVFLPAPQEEGTRHARHLYTLLLDIDRLTAGRDQVRAMLHQQRIGTGIHYRALHLHPYYSQRFGYAPDDFPNSAWISERTLSLPLTAAMTDEEVESVIFAVRRILRQLGAVRK
jgi:dTDP-4-amino-4,6-dideoxygalactose transaminase